ncbi:MAG: hypothetical protein ACLQBJ_06320 [Bryobacteraceae bacterium]
MSPTMQNPEQLNLAVARKLVAYLLAVDRRAGAFVAAGARQQVA